MPRIPRFRGRSAQRYAAHLHAFAQAAWPQLSSDKLLWNWHHQLIAEYLELFRQRRILRLAIATPPRATKSSLVSILFPSWCWATLPDLSFIVVSHSESLAVEFAVARRNLLQSPWFRRYWPDVVKFSADQNKKESYENTRHGRMLAFGISGAGIHGRGADFILIDDALSPSAAFSDLERASVNRLYDTQLRTRLNDPVHGGIAILGQRLGEDDLFGHVLSTEGLVTEGGRWTYVAIPMIAPEDQEIVYPVSGKRFIRKAGDLLDQRRWTREWCEQEMKVPFTWECQQQQHPVPLIGHLGISPSDFLFYGGTDPATGVPDALLPDKFDLVAHTVDCACKNYSSSDMTAIVTVGVLGPMRYVLNVINERLTVDQMEARIRELRDRYKAVGQVVVIEAAASGIAVAQRLKVNTPSIVEVIPHDSKVSRFMAAAAEIRGHNWILPRHGSFTPMVMEQVLKFDGRTGHRDDIVDAISQLSQWLTSNPAHGQEPIFEIVERPLPGLPAGGWSRRDNDFMHLVGFPGIPEVRPILPPPNPTWSPQALAAARKVMEEQQLTGADEWALMEAMGWREWPPS